MRISCGGVEILPVHRQSTEALDVARGTAEYDLVERQMAIQHRLKGWSGGEIWLKDIAGSAPHE